MDTFCRGVMLQYRFEGYTMLIELQQDNMLTTTNIGVLQMNTNLQQKNIDLLQMNTTTNGHFL